MNNQDIRYTIVKKQKLLELDQLPEWEQQELIDTALDCYWECSKLQCKHHPDSHKTILVSFINEEITLSVFCCCLGFGYEVRNHFINWPVKVHAGFLRHQRQHSVG